MHVVLPVTEVQIVDTEGDEVVPFDGGKRVPQEVGVRSEHHVSHGRVDAEARRPLVDALRGADMEANPYGFAFAEGSHRVARVVTRSEDRLVGQAWVSTCRSRWSPYPLQK